LVNNMNANIKAKIYALHNTLLLFSIQDNYNNYNNNPPAVASLRRVRVSHHYKRRGAD
jgi:hypothetical protein